MSADVRRIIAIGGGEIGRPKEDGNGHYPDEMIAIDTEILRLTDKKSASLLFIPTASNDSLQYFDTVKAHFQKIGFATVEVLLLSDASLTHNQIKESILSHDAIYVGGGNTKKMMAVWRELGVDSMLKQALDQGVVLSGISAGSICWFVEGVTDSEASAEDTQNPIPVTGLGFIDAVHCPHYDVESHRHLEVKKSIEHSDKVAICLDNCAAIEIIGDEYRVLKSKSSAKGYKAYWKDGSYFVEDVETSDTFKKLYSLLAK